LLGAGSSLRRDRSKEPQALQNAKTGCLFYISIFMTGYFAYLCPVKILRK
jgi:hypothetical protein